MRQSSLLFISAVVGVLAVSAVPSLANRATADKCAAGLSPDSKLIYAATIGSVAPGVDLKEVVTSKTRSLVMSGKVGRAGARTAAEAAGGCLKQAL